MGLGTHPIFESDFDCLTDLSVVEYSTAYVCVCVRVCLCAVLLEKDKGAEIDKQKTKTFRNVTTSIITNQQNHG